MAFPPRASFRFCLQYLMSDSAAVAGLIGSQPQLPIAYSKEGASREATAAEHGATPRGKSTSTQETVDSEDNASECRKNVVRLLLLLILLFLFQTFHLTIVLCCRPNVLSAGLR